MISNLDTCLVGLESHKILERGRSATELQGYLSNKHLVQQLNQREHPRITWDRVVETVHNYTLKESEKLQDDANKKPNAPLRKPGNDLLLTSVKIANDKEPRLNGITLLRHIFECFETSSLRTYYGDTYLTILKDTFLSEDKYVCEMENNDWDGLFSFIKTMYERQFLNLNRLLQCLLLIIQKGPLHKMSKTTLRHEFPFISNICKEMNNSQNKLFQENVMNVYLEFSYKTANDCCKASCKLSEQIITNFQDLPNNRYLEAKIKILLFECLHLQMKLHHPNHAPKDSPAAYACNWTEWMKKVVYLYDILCSEITNSKTAFTKSPILFGAETGKREMNKVFVNLMIAVFLQVYDQKSMNHLNDEENEEEIEPSAKRKKVEDGITSVISVIKQSKSWPWINFLTVLLEKHPNMINADNFLKLQQVLSTLQTDTNDADVRKHVHSCLATLVVIQKHIDAENKEINSNWSIIWDTALRSAGLNQNEQETHKLLQNLIVEEKISQFKQLFQLYLSEVLNVTSHSLLTLHYACSSSHIPEEVNSNERNATKESLLKWMLLLDQEKSSLGEIFANKLTAQILVCLTLKEWPFLEKILPINIYKNFSNFEDIYTYNAYEALIKIEPIRKTNTPIIIGLVDESLLELLKELLNEHLKNLESKINCNNKFIIAALNTAILLTNILSSMVEFNILKKVEVADNLIANLLKKVLEYLTDVLQEFFNRLTPKLHLQLLQILEVIHNLFISMSESCLPDVLKSWISYDFVKTLFEFLNIRPNDDDEDVIITTKNLSKINLVALSAICSYTFSKNVYELTDVQTFALESISEPYDPSVEENYNLALVFLKSLKHCEVGVIPVHILEMILKNIQIICEQRYMYYSTALEMLKVLQRFLPLAAACDCHELKEKTAVILLPFFEMRQNYGPQVSIELLNCMGLITQLDPGRLWSVWSDNRTIASQIPYFLDDNNQEVRLCAIYNLMSLFKTSNIGWQECSFQKAIFDVVCEKSINVFVVNEQWSREGEIDETVTRTASVLHTFASIMISSTVWRQYALFALLKIAHEKKLNTYSVEKIIQAVALHLDYKNKEVFVKQYVGTLIKDWYNNKLKLEEFPYQLLGCTSVNDFYSTFIDYIVPLLVKENKISDLFDICIFIDKTIEQIITKEIFPAIIAASAENIISCNQLEESIPIQCLTQLFPEEDLYKMIIIQMDEVIVNLLKLVSDMEHFREQYKVNYVLPELTTNNFTVQKFKTVLTKLEEKICNGSNILEMCTKNHPDKLQKIILNITIEIHESKSLEGKVKAFHQYSIIINELLPFINSNVHEMREFLIRDTVFKLINIINVNHEKHTIFNLIAAKYLLYFLQKTIKDCSVVLKKHLNTIIGTLVPIAKKENALGMESLNIINCLIVEHFSSFKEAIGELDPFPEDEQFFEIQNIYNKQKYSAGNFSLKQEIEHFLKVGENLNNFGNRLDALKHLKRQLATRKVELKDMYQKLKITQEECEEREESVLHKLICALVKLTSQPFLEVNLEATRCLAELGPADLNTMILQTESHLPNYNILPIQHFMGSIISLLTEYILDPDIKVMKAASEALYAVLECNSGPNTLKFDHNYENFFLRKCLLIPFLPPKDKKLSMEINNLAFKVLQNDNIWLKGPSGLHEDWIKNLTSKLLECFTKSFWSKLIPVCKNKVAFAENILPHLICLILSQNDVSKTQLISKKICNFFEYHWQLNGSEEKGKYEIVLKKASVQCMLNVVHYVRIQKNMNKKIQMLDLDLNYLEVAQAAQFCSAHFTALFYAELWCQSKLDGLPQSDKNRTLTLLDLICLNEDPNIANALQSIIRKSYCEVGDLDALHGCGSSYIADPANRIEHNKQLERWDNVALEYDLQLSQGQQQVIPNLLEALKNCGLYQLPLQYVNIPSEDEYECAWRLCNWNLQIPKTKHKAKLKHFEKYRYAALKCLHNNDVPNFNQAITDARNIVINSLRHVSLESSKNLYKTLTQVQALQEIEDFAASKQMDSFDKIIQKWNIQDSINGNSFEYIEPIKAQRITMVKDILKAGKLELKDQLFNMHLDLTERARVEGYFHIANRNLGSLSYLEGVTSEIQSKIKFQEAQLCWTTDKKTAQYILRNLLNENIDKKNEIYAAALKLYGTWMAETRAENAKTIIADYFMESLDVLKKITAKKQNTVDNIYDVIARFADKEYQRFVAYIKSSEFEMKVRNMEKLKESASAMQKRNKSTIDEKKAFLISRGQSAIDESEIEGTYKERNQFLLLGFKYYLTNLQYFDTSNVRIFRVLSLWLDNKSNTEIVDLLNAKLNLIPSYKFIPILPQLVPHITNNTDDTFGMKITQIVERCAKEHPHHTLPILMSIANSYNDEEYCNPSKPIVKEPRVLGSASLLLRLESKSHLKELIKNMKNMCNALIELAYYKEEKKSSKQDKYAMPKKLKLMNIRSLPDVAFPTINIPIKKNCQYDNIIGVHRFDNVFYYVGGVNAPKKLKCVGTDGIARLQLIKGKDDLRQDAVMQQVFTIMNDLLRSNKQSNKLKMRTYKVVPLSKRSGILEWVPQTIPIGDYLKKAHVTFRPKDKKPDQCSTEFKKTVGASFDKKLDIYQNICRGFKPVFHKFFETNFPQPSIWFERRRAYMYSVATSSMCGYILGLGDRHVQNILIDETTAEVVHIDFGIAFEQGLVLPTPETVPFRLTRDIEDGMGVSGVQGVFQRSCEKTMEALRQNAETIIAILQVLLYDPLYVWTVTAEEAYNRQRDSSEGNSRSSSQNYSLTEEDNVNVPAERALLRLQSKLQGTEEGSACSVEGQVEKLIQQARDPSNLCRLYYGWQPYL